MSWLFVSFDSSVLNSFTTSFVLWEKGYSSLWNNVVISLSAAVSRMILELEGY